MAVCQEYVVVIEKEELWRAAKLINGDHAVEEVFRRLEDRFVEDWKGSAPENEQKRMEAYYMVRAIGAVKSELTALASEPDILHFNKRLRKA
jgi:CRISPR/Cas system type I-B associated protein Csh2 (Cas7 group RAMP superfamily)